MLTAEALRERFQPLLEDDLALVDVKVANPRGKAKFTILLDHRERPITVEELERWSRRFEDELDMMDEVPRSYALDVSSPGITTPLEASWQFAKNVGRELEVELAPPAGRERGERFKERLEAVEGDELTFESGRTVTRSRVASATVALPW